MTNPSPTSAQSLRAEILALTAEIGKSAHIIVRLGSNYDSHAIVATIFPSGIGAQNPMFQVLTDEWEQLVPAIRDAWSKKQKDCPSQ